jgi:Tfp pilus assembly protein PilX
MKYIFYIRSNEKGSTLLISILILLLLTVIGIAATNTSTIEILISGNDKLAKKAFYAADGGIGYAIRAIEDIMENSGNAANYNVGDGNLTKLTVEIRHVDPDQQRDDPITSCPFLNPSIGSYNMAIYIDRYRRKYPPGSSAEFGGASSAAKVTVYHYINSGSSGPTNSRGKVEVNYKWVTL